MPDTYPSRIDRWVAALLLSPFVICAGMAVYLFSLGRPGDASSICLVGAATMAVTAVFTVPCRYTFLEDALSVRCGVVCYQVPYADMQNVEISSTILSGPALSMRRVVICTDKRKHILSPIDRERFIEQVRSKMQDALPTAVEDTK